MPAKFSRAPSEITGEIRSLIADRHPLLERVAIKVLLTTGDLKEHGIPVVAKAKVNDEAARLVGAPDVTLFIQRAEWEVLGLQVADAPRIRTAILDRLLHGLAVATDGEGEPREDAHGRPVVELVPPDWFLCGYAAMARRHGRFSVEAIEAARFREDFGPLLFDMAEDDEPARHPAERSVDFATEVLGMTREAVREINDDHEAAGMPKPFVNAPAPAPAAKAPRKARGKGGAAAAANAR